MYSAIFVLLLSAAAISADSDVVANPRFHPTLGLHPVKNGIVATQEYQDIVDYLRSNVSPADIQEMLTILPEALSLADDEEADVEARSFLGIPWGKITDGLKKMVKSNGKFQKVLDLVNDPKFRDLVGKTVNSHTLAEFVKDVATHGFSWTEFLHLLLHGLCSAADTLQHDKYTVGVCKILQSL